jgi:hypothetical protein
VGEKEKERVAIGVMSREERANFWVRDGGEVALRCVCV